MKFDEAELIEFFGVLPTEQSQEEQEFFGLTIFELTQDTLHLSISFSTYYSDFQLELRASDLQVPLLELQLEGVEEIRVRRDKPGSIPSLLIRAMGKDKEDGKAGAIQSVEVILQPNLNVKLNNRMET